MPANTFDVIVLGLGAMGSAAAYHLTKAGKRVLAIEQFGLDHTLGSSHGESRIIRYVYDDPAYIALARHSYPLWREVEEDTDVDLLTITGGLDFGHPDNPQYIATRRALDYCDIPYEWLTPGEVAVRFPQFTLKPDDMAIYQPDGGFVRASDAVVAQVSYAQENGAELMLNTAVTDFEIGPTSVTVQTTRGAISAGALVVAAGPWAGKMLAKTGLQLPLQPTREILTFFQTDDPALFKPDRCPVWIHHGETKVHYGIANADGVSGFKVAQHGRHEPTDPDNTRRMVEPEYIEQMRAFLAQYIPKGGGILTKTYVCLYTMTPDENFIIDQHPFYPHVAIGAGFSGHGFKFSTTIGKILGELATEGYSEMNNALFSLKRFPMAVVQK